MVEATRTANLKLKKKEKCQFGVQKLTFIGDVLTSDGVKPDPRKVSAILNMPMPQNKKDIQRFLGMVTYHAKWIPNLSNKTAQLRILLDEKNEWDWGPPQEKAWNLLKEILTTEPVLQYYDPEKQTKISADASKDGLGALLQ